MVVVVLSLKTSIDVVVFLKKAWLDTNFFYCFVVSTEQNSRIHVQHTEEKNCCDEPEVIPQRNYGAIFSSQILNLNNYAVAS